MDTNAVTVVLYALSTIAQTCAALAALVGALALYRLQGLRDDRVAQERAIREFMLPYMGGREDSFRKRFDTVLQIARNNVRTADVRTAEPGLPEALADWDAFDARYAGAVRWLVAFEAWNLVAILASLLGFACASWLASRWSLFAGLLIVCSLGTVLVTGGALLSIAPPNRMTRFAQAILVRLGRPGDVKE